MKHLHGDIAFVAAEDEVEVAEVGEIGEAGSGGMWFAWQASSEFTFGASYYVELHLSAFRCFRDVDECSLVRFIHHLEI